MVVEIGIEQFAGSLRGPLIQANDAEYEEARQVFNAMIDRRPRYIARCVDVADVIACVNFAREEGLVLSVRGGGHNVAGFGTNDGGLVIDLSRMRGIRVDPQKRTVRAQGGCTWGDVDHATHAFGFATPSGVVSTTGVGGLSLGGGMGHLTRPFGLTCDNLASADVVTADGEFVVASDKENTDLFWALRGGGGNFGVVTSFEFKLHPVSTVYAGPIFWSLDMASDAMKFWGEFIADATEDVNAIFALTVVPPWEPFPEHLQDKNICGAVVCCVGSLDKAEAVLRPLKEFGPPVLDGTGPMPYPVLQGAFDAVSPPGMQQYWKADLFEAMTDEMIAAHTKFGSRAPNIYSGGFSYPVDGAVHRVGSQETAWSYREANFSTVIFAADSDPAVMPQHTEYVRDYWEALHPYAAGGAYLNFIGDEGEDRVAASYRDNYARLAQIKRKYDPDNLFRMNQNIKPA
jgi:FAD/FMN-containing dehydrogenase